MLPKHTMRKTLLLLGFILCIFISNAQYKAYTIQATVSLTADSLLIVNGDTIGHFHSLGTDTIVDKSYVDSLFADTYVEFSDSTITFITPTQLSDSLSSLPGGHDAVTLATSATNGGLSLVGQQIGFQAASTSLAGYLTSGNFNIFNNKLSAVSHDATLSGNGTVASPLSADTTRVALREWVEGQDYITSPYLHYDSLEGTPTIPEISNIAYGASWDDNLDGASKNAIYDAIQSIGGTGATNLTYSATPDSGVVNSDTGTDAVIPAGSTVNASLMLPADKVYLDVVDDSLAAHRTDINTNISDISDLSDSIDVHRYLIEANTGKDTTGIYHVNRDLLDVISADDTTRWGAGGSFSESDLIYAGDSASIVWFSDTTSLIATKYDIDTISINGVTAGSTAGQMPYWDGDSWEPIPDTDVLYYPSPSTGLLKTKIFETEGSSTGYISTIENTNADGNGLVIAAGTSAKYPLRIYDNGYANELFNIRSNGYIYAHKLPTATADTILYLSGGLITKGLASISATNYWESGTNGIEYTDGTKNVGIRTAAASNAMLKVADATGISAGYGLWVENYHSAGHGALIQGGNGSGEYALRVTQRSYDGAELFNVRGDGKIYAPTLGSATSDTVLYYSGGLITKGLASGSGYWTKDGTILYPTSSEDIKITSATPSLYFADESTGEQDISLNVDAGALYIYDETGAATLASIITSDGSLVLNGYGSGSITGTATYNLQVTSGGKLIESTTSASAGWSYSVQTLSTTTPTWNANSGLNAKITLTGNTDITFSNLAAGQTGNLTVTNAASAYTLEFSGYTFKISPSLNSSAGKITMSGSSAVDVLSWYYDGTYVIINGTLAYD